MSTDLYRRTMAFEHRDPETAALMRKVWTPTPWMVDAFVGSLPSERERDIVEWCREQFGPEGSPIHEIAGTWHRGNAVIFGWAWFGFATEEQMQRFIAVWPTPAGEIAA